MSTGEEDVRNLGNLRSIKEMKGVPKPHRSKIFQRAANASEHQTYSRGASCLRMFHKNFMSKILFESNRWHALAPRVRVCFPPVFESMKRPTILPCTYLEKWQRTRRIFLPLFYLFYCHCRARCTIHETWNTLWLFVYIPGLPQ